jgi:hypothetical protein
MTYKLRSKIEVANTQLQKHEQQTLSYQISRLTGTIADCSRHASHFGIALAFARFGVGMYQATYGTAGRWLVLLPSVEFEAS